MPRRHDENISRKIGGKQALITDVPEEMQALGNSQLHCPLAAALRFRLIQIACIANNHRVNGTTQMPQAVERLNDLRHALVGRQPAHK